MKVINVLSGEVSASIIFRIDLIWGACILRRLRHIHIEEEFLRPFHR